MVADLFRLLTVVRSSNGEAIDDVLAVLVASTAGLSPTKEVLRPDGHGEDDEVRDCCSIIFEHMADRGSLLAATGCCYIRFTIPCNHQQRICIRHSWFNAVVYSKGAPLTTLFYLLHGFASLWLKGTSCRCCVRRAGLSEDTRPIPSSFGLFLFLLDQSLRASVCFFRVCDQSLRASVCLLLCDRCHILHDLL